MKEKRNNTIVTYKRCYRIRSMPDSTGKEEREREREREREKERMKLSKRDRE